MNQSFIVRYLGICDYFPVWQAMKQFTLQRKKNTLDEIWIVQHPSVFTLGQAGKLEHVLNPDTIPVIHTDRGGQVTYHGLGQWVFYVLLDVKRLGKGPRELVTNLENTIVTLLKYNNIIAYAKPHAPGVYVDNAKIAAIGLRFRRHCSYHGLSFNCNMDLSPFSRINPCGYAGQSVTSLASILDVSIDAEKIKNELLQHLINQLGYQSVMMQTSTELPNS